jgi:hypothetical protein
MNEFISVVDVVLLFVEEVFVEKEEKEVEVFVVKFVAEEEVIDGDLELLSLCGLLCVLLGTVVALIPSLTPTPSPSSTNGAI